MCTIPVPQQRECVRPAAFAGSNQEAIDRLAAEQLLGLGARHRLKQPRLIFVFAATDSVCRCFGRACCRSSAATIAIPTPREVLVPWLFVLLLRALRFAFLCLHFCKLCIVSWARFAVRKDCEGRVVAGTGAQGVCGPAPSPSRARCSPPTTGHREWLSDGVCDCGCWCWWKAWAGTMLCVRRAHFRLLLWTWVRRLVVWPCVRRNRWDR